MTQVLPNNATQRSQAAGELSPEMYGHTDQEKYESGLRICRNTIVLRQGVTSNRPGLEFVASAKDQATAVRLLKFEFSSKDALVMEFGNLYVRFYKFGAQVVATGVAPYSTLVNYVPGDMVTQGFGLGEVTYVCLQPSGPADLVSPPFPGYWYPLVDAIYE